VDGSDAACGCTQIRERHRSGSGSAERLRRQAGRRRVARLRDEL